MFGFQFHFAIKQFEGKKKARFNLDLHYVLKSSGHIYSLSREVEINVDCLMHNEDITNLNLLYSKQFC